MAKQPNLKPQKIGTAAASDKAPSRMQTLPVSPVRTIKGPKINVGGSRGPEGATGVDKGSSWQD